MNPFLGQTILFAGNFAPRGWAFCHGQLLPIAQNTALFSLLGTTYGGDGKTTFSLPDMRGRVPISKGTGPGLQSITLGQRGGAETTTLTVGNLPQSQINIGASSEDATSDEPSGMYYAVSASNTFNATPDETMLRGSFLGAQSTPINNIQPSLALNYIICLEGVYPSRP